MKKKHIIISTLVLLFMAVPVSAVFNEKDLGQTLSVLRYELSQEYYKMTSRSDRLTRSNNTQHRQLVEIMKKCNELSLMLYSQNQDYTFDMTYALKEVTRQYEDFNSQKMPFDEIISRLDIEIERYSRLIESLRRLPPQLHEIEELPDSLAYHNDSLKVNYPSFMSGQVDDAVAQQYRKRLDSLRVNGQASTFLLDEKGEADRDSCIHYATELLKMYSTSKDRIVKDNEHYDDASARLKESYDYAQERYKVLQKKMFTNSQDNYFKVISTFPSYCKRAFEDAVNKYSRSFSGDSEVAKSEWRGPIVVGFMLLVIFYIAIATVLSIALIKLLKKRVKAMQNETFRQRIPVLTLLCGVAIFAVTISIGRYTIQHNFFAAASPLLLIFAWLLIAILSSMLIRYKGEELNDSIKQYIPVILLGLIVITFRVIFIPNRMMTLLYPPLLLATFVWQMSICKKNSEKENDLDTMVSWICLVVLGVATVMAWLGYVLLSIIVAIWWLFQVAAIETVTTLNVLLDNYEKTTLKTKINEFRKKHRLPSLASGSEKWENILVTWLFDFVKMAVIPVVTVLSVPLAVWLALDVFDITEIYRVIFKTTFFNFQNADGAQILKLSMRMIILATCLFFFFKYLCYLLKSLYKVLTLRKISRKFGRARIQANEVNFTLADNVISILVWGIYIILTISLLRIPMGAISIVAAGLATGLGLAMKDILNNFIYGIQLMSGRLRVGDWVECDGIRGKVNAISYQSTQIETIDGAVMSFLNTDLFNRNFKNLTRNNAYEFVKVVVGVKYGADIEEVRRVLLDAMRQADAEDDFGRAVVDRKRGVSVVFESFGDSSVNVAVKQYVLVTEKVGYVAKAQEIIYNALNEHGIEIPFPQRDIHVRNSE